MPLPTPITRRAGARLAAAAALLLSAVGVGAAAAAPAQALDYGSYNLSGVTGTGLHNTYNDKSEYTYLANALDTGTSLVELDTWANALNGKWDVSHSDPLASDNNCVQSSSYADDYTGDRNQNLDSCLDDIRYWLLDHPASHPIMVKIEMKNGFGSWSSQTPAAFDTYVQTHLSGVLYTPKDLLTKSDGTMYPTLDAAATADNWGNYASLEGKAIVEIIPGTYEQATSSSSTWVDQVYAQHLIDLYDAGTIADAAVFPSVLGAQTGDPRLRYSNTALRPWFVVFDQDAGAFVSDGDTEWYNTNHYLAVVTDAYDVAPALSSSAPSLADAEARVAELAADGASYVSTDWYNSPGDGVLSEVLARG
ncbi:hypothetical protein KDK95_04190 [Actinospica sp. MGRD01-02]|uniref:Uncharacterized protein n=1 Tax=Actinospica acidithermotolerans TaxID=2828514 RepID=A0A941IHT4_9ACTN|nr:hypothetical protein [Actinospica acidithermotolerans]MBR7825493.1 hypothetical protein [Actinospica acidithermotolerans]